MPGIRKYFNLAVVLVIILSSHTGRSQNCVQNPSDSVSLIQFTDTPRIDGYLDENVWQQATAINCLIQREPDEGQPVSEKTEILIYYDDKNIYFGIHCYDSQPAKIIASEMRRDQYLLDNDCIEIFLDTYHDHQSAFYFSTNPLGAQRDGIVLANLVDEIQNWDWNGVWENACRIDSSGWYAEIAIPFKTLRFRAAREQTWGFNIARFIPRKREEAFWSPIRREYGFWGKYHLSTFGHLGGLRNIENPTKMEIKPFTLAGLQRDFIESNHYENKLNFGLDARYLITTNLTATITLNTDFAQVEADQEQVNLTRFELFFPEKREFFLEGAGIFNVSERSFNPFFMPSMLFFSRRIGLSEDNKPVQLIGGLKLTGKTGGFDIGLLNILTDRTHYITDDDEEVKIGRTDFTVLRLKKNIFGNSWLGIIGLNKQSLDDSSYNRNFGVDMNLFLTQNMQMSGFVARSYSPDQSGHDYAGYLDFFYTNDLWILYAAQSDIQENFNAEMGFFPRTNIRRSDLYTCISPRPDLFDIRQLYLFNDFSYLSNQQGQLETRMNFSGFMSYFENGSYILFLFLQNYERLTEEFEIHDNVIIPTGVYPYNNIYAEFQTDKSKFVSTLLSWRSGKFYNGNLSSIGLRPNLKLGAHFTMNLMIDFNDAHLPAGNFTATILGLRLVYTFTPRLFIKPFVQWNNDTKEISSNLLVNFIHHPGSDIFFVYNELLDLSGSRTRTKNRTLLIKLTYLFNM
jgi:hypothetical protein